MNYYKVVESALPKNPQDIDLVRFSEQSRIASIASKSAPIYAANHNPSTEHHTEFLTFLDLIDFPGADATNERTELRDKALRVFEKNTHECDLMTFVIGTSSGSHNLGQQIKYRMGSLGFKMIF